MTVIASLTEGTASDGASALYRAAMSSLTASLRAGTVDGTSFIRRRSAAVDTFIQALWKEVVGDDARLRKGVLLLATGGYGRAELFPCSDVDLLFAVAGGVPERELKEAIRALSRQMWDAGARFAPITRRIAECEQVDPDNIEFGLALLDLRIIAGDPQVSARFVANLQARQMGKDRKLLLRGVTTLTQSRHARFGDTLFHLEPNVKDCPGGLRDAHVCRWLARLNPAEAIAALTIAGGSEEFEEAVGFLAELRCFLHLVHDRDDNTLDWQSQDKAAAACIGMRSSGNQPGLTAPDAAYWMRIYFRNARRIERMVVLAQGSAGVALNVREGGRGTGSRRGSPELPAGYVAERGRVSLAKAVGGIVPGGDPEAVLHLFAEIARSGLAVDAAVEADLLAGLARLATQLEDGTDLWHQLRVILLGRYAGIALRVMHGVGLLDLLVPEFHGIDSLVIRDAYHRYTVDEHTFVVIDTLHALGEATGRDLDTWSMRFAQLLRELPHPELLYLASLMHDTGKARSAGDHTIESARLTEGVLTRLELEPYEATMVVSTVRNHLEMSAALRRDIFDAETIRAFACKVQTPEALRMLTLFTYADLNAVHPDALTSWKAENLWRLYMATSNFLDHSVDEERVGARASELVSRIAATMPEKADAIAAFLEGFPERYVRTRTAEQIRMHFAMSQQFQADTVQLDFRYTPTVSELVLVSIDRKGLFANVAGVLASWGMNIVTADAFSNRRGVVVDTFRFTDSFKTLELNASEHSRLLGHVHDVLAGILSVDKLLSGRKRSRRRGLRAPEAPRVSFSEAASAQSTLMEVVTDDTPGLLRALSLTLAAQHCNIEVALVDTEGECAIDVFYLTKDGRRLEASEKADVVKALQEAIAENAH